MEKFVLEPIIASKRIELRRHDTALAEKMFSYVDEDRQRLAKFLPWVDFVKSIEDETDFINRCNQSWDKCTAFQLGIYRISDNEYMGNVGAFNFDWINHCFEIGYWILGKFEGNGYMSEAVTALEKAMFERGFHRSVIRCNCDNVRSKSIPQRLGYTFEGIQRGGVLVAGSHLDIEVFSKLSTDPKPELKF